MDINFPFRVNAETFIGVRNHLQVLEIANTSLTLLPSFQLPQLKTLNVSANHLTFVPPETLGRDYYFTYLTYCFPTYFYLVRQSVLEVHFRPKCLEEVNFSLVFISSSQFVRRA